MTLMGRVRPNCCCCRALVTAQFRKSLLRSTMLLSKTRFELLSTLKKRLIYFGVCKNGHCGGSLSQYIKTCRFDLRPFFWLSNKPAERSTELNETRVKKGAFLLSLSVALWRDRYIQLLETTMTSRLVAQTQYWKLQVDVFFSQNLYGEMVMCGD